MLYFNFAFQNCTFNFNKIFIKGTDKERSDVTNATHLQLKYIKRQPIYMSHKIQSDTKQMTQ